MSRGRGGGSASAVTIPSWSALATMTRSTGSVSSAERRSTDVRGATRTMRDSVPGSPEASPARLTRSPTTTLPRTSSRAFMAVTCRSASSPPVRTQVYLPRSTAITNASAAPS